MTTQPQPDPAHRTPRPAAAKRGSVLVVVVVVIVLLTVLGAVYLQVAQVQRAVAAQPIDNIDTILASVVQEIQLQLAQDIFDDSGVLFGPGVEPWDRPMLNTGATRPVPDPITGAPGNAPGGTNDDVWLDSAFPYNDSGTMRWARVSDLSGRVFNRDTTTGHPTGNSQVITTALMNDVDITNNQLVDADGDGIGDSRWERAPIPLMTGVEYFMAVRIIDASSLVNLRAGTSITANGTDTVGDITGYFPTSQDISRLIQKRTGSANAGTDLDSFFTGLRQSHPLPAVAPFYPTPFGLTNLATGTYGGGQIRSWLDDIAQPGSLTPYATDLVALAYRNGAFANTSGGGTDYEAQLGAALDAPGAERGTSQNEWAPAATAASFPSIRHKVTPFSGHALFASNRDGGAFRTKDDLNYRDAATPQTRATRIRDRLQSIFALNGGVTGQLSPAELAAAFAANIAEYSDYNNLIDTAVTSGGVTWYGLEALPFLREAYVQVLYQDTGGDLVWEPVPDSHGVIVEIGNPFDRPIIFNSADPDRPAIRIALLKTDGTTETELDTFEIPDSAPTMPPRDPTGTDTDREELIFIADGTAALDETGETKGQFLTTSILSDNPDYPFNQVSMPGFDLSGLTEGDEVIFAMQVEVGAKGSGNWVTYDRLYGSGTDSISFPDEVDFNQAGSVPPAAKASGRAWMQKGITRAGGGIDYLSNSGKVITVNRVAADLVAPDANNWPGETATEYVSDADNFGTDNKGPAGDPNLDDFQLTLANRPIFSVAELGWILMFGFAEDFAATNGIPGGDLPALLSGPDGTTPTIPRSEWFLRFDNNAPLTTNAVAATVGGQDITYAELVMDEFTTLHPGYDGVDNDGDGSIDNDREQFVFGTMNINTAPRHLATLAASYPGSIAQTEALIGVIQGGGVVASMGQVVSRIVAGTAPPGAGEVAFDLYPMPEATLPVASGGQEAVQYPIAGDAEEAMKRAQFFLQTFTNRSDVFIAHIFVGGYTGSGGTYDELIESGRMIVIFNRANMTSANDSPEVLASFRY